MEDGVDSKLSSAEMSVLQSLEPGAPGHARCREGDLPQKLFAFNLVTRQPCGTTVLTKVGERALFGQACTAALAAIARGESAPMAAGVRKWLLSSGFVKAGSGSATPAITPRGKLWLASFDQEMATAAAEPTAADFARRRACV